MSDDPGRHRGGAPADDEAERLLQVIRELAVELHSSRRSTIATSGLDSSLDTDLGLDSLARAELLVRIEQMFGAALPERLFSEAETPRDLLRALKSGTPTQSLAVTTPPPRPAAVEAEAAPHSAKTLPEVLDWHAAHHPDRVHIHLHGDDAEGETLSYRELLDGARRIAAGLQHHGILPGDSVAIMLPTGREYFLSFWGVLLTGAVPVPIYPPVRRTQVEDHLRRHQAILTNCLAKVLITVGEAKQFARLLTAQVEPLRKVLAPEELDSAVGELASVPIPAEGTALLQYTSGSTGNPKGVTLTHANLLANIRVMGEAVEVTSTDILVSWLPLYHDMGLIGFWLGSLYFASPLVVMSPLAFLSRPQRWLRAIDAYRGTLSAAPNFGYELCLRILDRGKLPGLDLSSWRGAFNGAEPVSPHTVRRFCERFAQYGFRSEAMMPVYGLAECSVGLAFPPLGRGPIIDRIQRDRFMDSGHALPAQPGDDNPLQFVACGHPLPGHQIRIVDASDRELPERHEGHLQFRGPSATSGYFRNAEATRQLFHREWLVSGDLAYVVGGEAYVTGRTKDLIIRAGRNLYPHELEEAVGDLPEIRKGRVAVFASTDPRSGTERLVLVAETADPSLQESEELRSRINALTADLTGTPADDIVLAPPGAVLKTSSGKIRRAACRELYEEGRLGIPSRAVWWQVLRVMLTALYPAARRARRRVADLVFAVYAWVLAGFLGVGLWLGVALLPRRRWCRKLIDSGVRFLARATGTPLVVRGLQHLAEAGPCVMVSNHASYLDGFLLAASLPLEFSFVAKAELARNFITRIPLRRMNTEFVERIDKERGLEDARRVGTAARSGRSLLFFPEGTFTRMPGLLPFHMGAFVAAAEARAPIIPIAIRGTRSILRSGSWFPHRGAVTIAVTGRIDTKAVAADGQTDRWTLALKLQTMARERILRHCGEPDLARERSPV